MATNYDELAAKFGGALADAAPVSTIPLSPVVQNGNMDYYNTIPDHIKPMVNAVIEGRVPSSGRNSVDKKFMTNLIMAASNIDPTFDATVFQNRQNVRKEYSDTKGGAGANMQALSTAIHHLGSLYDNYQGMNNTDTPWVNKAENYLLDSNVGGFGSVLGLKNKVANTQFYQGKVGSDANAVSEELAKVFRSSGMSEQDVNAWRSKINPDMTPTQMKGVIGEAINLMNGRFDPLVSRYNQVLGTSKDKSFFMTPSALKDLERVQKGTATPDSPYIPPEQTVKKSTTAPSATANGSSPAVQVHGYWDPKQGKVVYTP
jgi:hypothetical protein